MKKKISSFITIFSLLNIIDIFTFELVNNIDVSSIISYTYIYSLILGLVYSSYIWIVEVIQGEKITAKLLSIGLVLINILMALFYGYLLFIDYMLRDGVVGI